MDSQPAQTPAGPPRSEGISPTDPNRRLQPSRREKRRRTLILSLGVVVILMAVGIVVYQRYAAWESTDDAQIDGYIFPVSSRVPGYVTRVLVDNNQYVEAGAVLAQLDPKDFEVAVTNAKAALANSEATAASQQSTCLLPLSARRASFRPPKRISGTLRPDSWWQSAVRRPPKLDSDRRRPTT